MIHCFIIQAMALFLEACLDSDPKIEILRYFSANPGIARGQRELSRATRISQSSLSRILGDLAKQGILLEEARANLKLYSLNQDSLLAKELILPLFERERRLIPDLVERSISKLSPGQSKRLERVILFGSLARGQAGAHSDIDLLALTRTPSKEIQHELQSILFEEAGGLNVDIKVETIANYEAGQHPYLVSAKKSGQVVWRSKK